MRNGCIAVAVEIALLCFVLAVALNFVLFRDRVDQVDGGARWCLAATMMVFGRQTQLGGGESVGKHGPSAEPNGKKCGVRGSAAREARVSKALDYRSRMPAGVEA